MKPNIAEIEECHGLLHAMLEYDQFDKDQPETDRLPAEVRDRLHAAHDAISFCLGLSCGEAFSENMLALKEMMKSKRLRLECYTSGPE